MERHKDISCMDPHFLMSGGVIISKNQNHVLKLRRKNRRRSLLIYGVRDNGIL